MLITWHQLALEMPLWLVIVILTITFILIYFLIRFFKFFSMLPKKWHHNRHKKRLQATNALEDQRFFLQFIKNHKIGIIFRNFTQLENKTWIALKHKFNNCNKNVMKIY